MYRILVVLPFYGGSLPIGRYCAKALCNLGHSVRVFDSAHLHPALEAIKSIDLRPSAIAPLEKSFLHLVSQAIWLTVEEQHPQFVLALAQAPIDTLLLKKLRQAAIPSVMWFVEDFRLFTYWKIYAPLYAAFAVIQKEPFLSELAALGQEHAFYLPLAALPEFHRHLKLTPGQKQKYSAAISFLGAGYPNRRLAFQPLKDSNFKIWGSDWKDENILKDNIQRNGERIGEDEAVKIYNATGINLNLHSSIHTDQLVSHGDFVNPRTFEVAATGNFQLVDKRALLPELFGEDEMATFDSLEEMIEKLRYFAAHPEERKLYAAKARARVLKDHTYEQRMKVLVDYMAKNFDLQHLERETLPRELEENLRKIAVEIGLNANASVADIAASLSRYEGKLSDRETAALFLERWQQQYGKFQ